MPNDVQVQALSADAFKPYGEALDLNAPGGHPVNAGTSWRIDLPGPLALHAEGGAPVLAVFRARAQAPDGPWQVLERHRLGSQTFIPLAGARCVVLVALGDDTPDPATLAAFAVRGDQGMTLHPGIWHHPLLARDDGDFLVIERRGQAVDCEVLQLDVPVRLQFGPTTG